MKFNILDVWTGRLGGHCDDCAYKQTHLSYVPYGEATAELVAETCVVLEDVNIPETECPGYVTWGKGNE